MLKSEKEMIGINSLFCAGVKRAFVPANWTAPVRVLEGLPGVLPVALLEAGATELPLVTPATSGPADRFGVEGFLTALVTRGSIVFVMLGIAPGKCKKFQLINSILFWDKTSCAKLKKWSGSSQTLKLNVI